MIKTIILILLLSFLSGCTYTHLNQEKKSQSDTTTKYYPSKEFEIKHYQNKNYKFTTKDHFQLIDKYKEYLILHHETTNIYFAVTNEGKLLHKVIVNSEKSFRFSPYSYISLPTKVILTKN